MQVRMCIFLSGEISFCGMESVHIVGEIIAVQACNCEWVAVTLPVRMCNKEIYNM